jgi:hypothetical protein
VIDGYMGRTDTDEGKSILRVYTDKAKAEASLAKLLASNPEAAASVVICKVL